jgi:hypothetical protein
MEAIFPPFPSKRSLGRMPQRLKPSSTSSLVQPAKQWNKIADSATPIDSDGVLSSCAGQQHIPDLRDQWPPRALTI